MYDYHVHTALCKHAEGLMADYVRHAAKKGLQGICFLDHLTLAAPQDPLSMTPEEIPHYVQAVRHLRHAWRDVLDVRLGLEVDFNPGQIDTICRVIETFAFDVVGGSVHFIDGWNLVSRRSREAYAKQDVDGIYYRYLEQMDRMLDGTYFDVVCHLDVVKKFGYPPSPPVLAEFKTILKKIRRRNLAVEVNTSGYRHPAGDLYPSADLLKECRELGIRVVMGSDAHQPSDVGRDFDRATQVLKTVGYERVTSFKNRRPTDMALMA